MDSVTLAWHLQSLDWEQYIISFDYGQRHAKELEFAAECAYDLGADHDVIDLRELSQFLNSSSLTDPNIDVPDGHYAEETMKITVVPNRNMIMLSIAVGIAVAGQYQRVFVGVHAGDHFIYPDCREAFYNALNEAVQLGTDGFSAWDDDVFAVATPFVGITKADIVMKGAALGVPYEATWSCYKGKEIHCGRCGTCVERKEAFRLAEVADPTVYEDEDFEVAAYRG
jgi:7-cyano-7-deazaguanine synthase